MLSSFDIPSLESMNRLLPTYDFTALIAANETSAVYSAAHKALDRKVAIKILSPEVSKQPESRQAFESAVRIMAKLTHINLIGVYNSGSCGNMLYMVMEYVAGESLQNAAGGKPIQLTQILQIMPGICAGLAYAHRNGVVHGHLTPSNILITQRIEPKIGNFGFTHSRRSTDDCNISPYSAPEITADPSARSPLGDIFAVGAIFHELVTGQPHSLNEPPAPSTSKLANELDAVVRLATHPDPAQRFQDMPSFMTAIESLSRHLRPQLAFPSKKPKPKILLDLAQPIHRPKLHTALPLPGQNPLGPGALPVKKVILRSEPAHPSPRPKVSPRPVPGRIPPSLRKPNS